MSRRLTAVASVAQALFGAAIPLPAGAAPPLHAGRTRYLYAAIDSGAVWGFRCHADGTLTLLGESQPVGPAGVAGFTLVGVPNSDLLAAFVPAAGTHPATLTMLRVRRDTGGLISAGRYVLDFGVGGVTVERSGRRLYLVCDSGRIVSYRIRPSGALAERVETDASQALDTVCVSSDGRLVAALGSWHGLDSGSGWCFLFRADRSGRLRLLNRSERQDGYTEYPDASTHGGMPIATAFDVRREVVYTSMDQMWGSMNAHTGIWSYAPVRGGRRVMTRLVSDDAPWLLAFTAGRQGEHCWTSNLTSGYVVCRSVTRAGRFRPYDVLLHVGDRVRVMTLDPRERFLYVAADVPQDNGSGPAALEVYAIDDRRTMRFREVQTAFFGDDPLTSVVVTQGL